MTDRFRFPASLRRAAVAGALVLGALALAMTGLTQETGFAQELEDVQALRRWS